MPHRNHFRHQEYVADEPSTPWRQVIAEYPAQPNTEAFSNCSSRFRDSIAKHVDSIVLVHGTFAGNDALGWFGQLERIVPSAGPVLRKYGKKLTDVLAGDDGNFTPKFQALFPATPSTRRFVWSGENTHSGRCRAAIELLDDLMSRMDAESRVLLWTHSHAANVVALVTNLIAAEPMVQEKFLALVEPLFSNSEDGLSQFDRVTSGLRSQQTNHLKLDIVNFGAPITYGWDTGGYRRLAHVVNHATVSEQPSWLCPLATPELRSNERQRGDLVQLLGITGSDFLPWMLNGKTRLVEKSLHQFLASDFSRRSWWARARIGMRVAEEGETVLVDYENRNKLASITFGHSVYTRPEWLSFHLDLISEIYAGK